MKYNRVGYEHKKGMRTSSGGKTIASYGARITQSEVIALRLLDHANRRKVPREPTPVTIKKFSWEK